MNPFLHVPRMSFDSHSGFLFVDFTFAVKLQFVVITDWNWSVVILDSLMNQLLFGITTIKYSQFDFQLSEMAVADALECER